MTIFCEVMHLKSIPIDVPCCVKWPFKNFNVFICLLNSLHRSLINKTLYLTPQKI